MTAVAGDTRASHAIYAQPRLTDRWELPDASAEQRIRALLDAGLDPDPMYPDWQRVRTTYLAPPPGVAQSEYPRVREYLGAIGADDRRPATPGPNAFLEVKFAGADGSKHKSRITVDAGALERLRTMAPHEALAVDARAGADQVLASRVSGLVDEGWTLEPGTEYGRLAWENREGTFRVTLDRVGPSGASLGSDNILRRRLEVKALTGARAPEWLTNGIADAVAAGDLTSQRALRVAAEATYGSAAVIDGAEALLRLAK